jgi:hypothetical protein
METKQDTFTLQMKSLCEFAKQLGYYLSSCQVTGVEYFYSSLPENKHRSTVAFNTMVKLHNGYIDWHGGNLREPFSVDAYTFTRAVASRIIERCKLQYSKKKKRIVCQEELVMFVKPQYEHLFLREVE